MSGVAGWYVILGTAILVMAFVLRYSTYTLLVHQNRWLPEKAQATANLVSGIVFGIGVLVLGGKAIFFSR